MKRSSKLRLYRWSRYVSSGGMVLLSTEWKMLKRQEALARLTELSQELGLYDKYVPETHLSLRRETHDGPIKGCPVCRPIDDTEYDDG